MSGTCISNLVERSRQSRSPRHRERCIPKSIPAQEPCLPKVTVLSSPAARLASATTTPGFKDSALISRSVSSFLFTYGLQPCPCLPAHHMCILSAHKVLQSSGALIKMLGISFSNSGLSVLNADLTCLISQDPPKRGQARIRLCVFR